MREHVSRFLETYLDGEQAEDWLVDYVVEYLENPELVSGGMSDLAEVLAPSCPGFDALPEGDRLEKLMQLHEQVHNQSACPPGPEPAHSDTEDQLSSVRLDQCDEASSSLGALRELCPTGISEEFLAHVLNRHGAGNVERAAEWLLECEDVGEQEKAWRAAEVQRQKQAEADEAAERRARKAMLDRFMLQELKPLDSLNKQPPPQAWSSKAPCSGNTNVKQVRYRDGMVASTKGEKYVVQKLGEEWDGGSKGKVYTKGKRGKGVV